MAGGNTSSSKRPYRNLKGGSQLNPEVMSLYAAQVLSSEKNLNIDGLPVEDYIDTEYGLSMWKPTPDAKGDTQGNSGWKSAGPGGDNRAPNLKVGGSKDPTPGGGW